MPETSNRPLRVFLCHSSNDKPLVRELYQKLRAEDWIQPWLDEEELFPGQDWNLEIEKAVEAADVILVCLSNNSVNKEGYVQRELRLVLDDADYKPEGTLYIIPVRLEECEPPRRLRPWQYADYFPKEGRARAFQRLLVSLKRRAESLGLNVGRASSPTVSAPKTSNPTSSSQATLTGPSASLTYATSAVVRDAIPHYENKITLSNGMEFMRVPAGPFLMGSKKERQRGYPQFTLNISYDYWMARYLVTNELYDAYVKTQGINRSPGGWEKKDHPVVDVSWNDAVEYCYWLNNHHIDQLPSGWVLRLPTEAEWEKAARGVYGYEWPWGDKFDKDKCHVLDDGKSGTTPVGFYSPLGDSPYGCADMAGNVCEWTHSLFKPYPYKPDDGREDEKSSGEHVLRGGSFVISEMHARCASRTHDDLPSFDLGFRMVMAPSISEVIKLNKQ